MSGDGTGGDVPHAHLLLRVGRTVARGLAGNRLLEPLDESATLTALVVVGMLVTPVPPLVFQPVLVAVPVVAVVRAERQDIE